MLDYEIGVEQLKSALDAREPMLLLDVREPWEHQVAHIDGSKLVPMNEIPRRKQELDPTAHIVVLCHHGRRSLDVTQWLRQQGFENAQSLRGGIDAWSRVVDPKVPVY